MGNVENQQRKRQTERGRAPNERGLPSHSIMRTKEDPKRENLRLKDHTHSHSHTSLSLWGDLKLRWPPLSPAPWGPLLHSSRRTDKFNQLQLEDGRAGHLIDKRQYGSSECKLIRQVGRSIGQNYSRAAS